MSQAKVVLSFLGKGKYYPTIYQLDDKREEVEYFAQALCAFYPDYQLKIVMTQEAKDAHHESVRQICSYDIIEVPSGKNEAELWEMFAAFSESIDEGTHLIVDVTHGFRSQPMLALAACIYLRAVKGVIVEQIIYGAWEAKNEEGIAPVFDLKPFLELLDWSFSTQVFRTYGNAAPLRDVLLSTHDAEISGIGQVLRKFTQSLALIRPQETLKLGVELKMIANETQETLSSSPSSQPFVSLLSQFEEKLRPIAGAEGNLFSEQGFEAQAEMIDFYLSTEQYTQAITLAREALTSKVCVDNDYDPSNRKHRQKKANGNLYKLASVEKLAKKAKCLRDDLNHAGMVGEEKGVDEAIEEVRTICSKLAKEIIKPKGTFRFDDNP